MSINKIVKISTYRFKNRSKREQMIGLSLIFDNETVHQLVIRKGEHAKDVVTGLRNLADQISKDANSQVTP